MLYQLKRPRIDQHELVTYIVIVIRPVREYAYPVWHTINLNRYLTESIETLQKRPLNCINPDYEYADIIVFNEPTVSEGKTR